jgi:hypothetical protein
VITSNVNGWLFSGKRHREARHGGTSSSSWRQEEFKGRPSQVRHYIKNKIIMKGLGAWLK